MRELFVVFLRLGMTSFGGPAAHIALMENEFVRRRQWLSAEDFFDLVGAAGLIPGPSSTEVAIYVGYRRAGWRGLLVAGCAFILPAALLVLGLAWAYVRYGHLPALGGALDGIKAVLVAVLLHALVAFGRSAVKSRFLAALAVVAVAATVLGAPPLAVLVGAGALSVVTTGRAVAPLPGLWLAAPAKGGLLGAAASTSSLAKLFFVFLKVGALVFGSGYVLLAFLRTDLCERLHWISEAQLLDAVAVGQFTPGPVFTTATFIGYLVAGVPGAVAATVAIFLPSFVLVAVSGPLIPRLRRSRFASSFLDGVKVASFALMAVVSWQLGRSALVDAPSVALAVGSGMLLVRWPASSTWLVLGGGVAGALRHALG